MSTCGITSCRGAMGIAMPGGAQRPVIPSSVYAPALTPRAPILHFEVPRKDLMPKKNSPTRSKKYDHPQDMAPGSKTPVAVKTPKHPKKSEKR
jgi:hypothetical protein